MRKLYDQYNSRLFMCLIALFCVGTLFLTSCSYYSRFNNGDYPYTFEYPRSWDINETTFSPNLISTSIIGDMGNEEGTWIGVDLDIWIWPDISKGDDALNQMKSAMSYYVNYPNFSLIRSDPLVLDGCKGNVIEYNVDVNDDNPNIEKRKYFPIKVMDIMVIRDSKAYEINLSARQNDWKMNEKDIQHILDSFKWK
jgi:hypothetical protein